MIRRMKAIKEKIPSFWGRTSKIEKLVVAVSLFIVGYAVYSLFLV